MKRLTVYCSLPYCFFPKLILNAFIYKQHRGAVVLHNNVLLQCSFKHFRDFFLDIKSDFLLYIYSITIVYILNFEQIYY
jgi:hypothetical protein